MPPRRDITGQRNGKLVAIKKAGKRGGKRTWLCQCDCGRFSEVVISQFKDTKSCGHCNDIIIGKEYGHLTPVKKVRKGTTGKPELWECACRCGRTKVVQRGGLNRGSTTSCGVCNGHQIEKATKDIRGKQHGALLPIRISHKKRQKSKGKRVTRTYWFCKCTCGRYTIVQLASLTTGKTKSCGCLAKEVLKLRKEKRGAWAERIKQQAEIGNKYNLPWDETTELVETALNTKLADVVKPK